MSKPINLRQHRKRKAREDQARKAEANRIKHGAPQSARDLAEAREARRNAALDAHRRDRDDKA